jgi:hypothetical protein
MRNHCAFCHGKFGLVRHRRASKSFCSRTCVDQHKAWLRADVRNRRGFLDCLWAASLSVIPTPTPPRALDDELTEAAPAPAGYSAAV